jgi:TPR repeat protein
MAPSPDNSFEIGKTLFIYFQINRIPGEHKREGHIEYRIIKERDNQRVDSWVRKCGDYHTDLEFFEKKSLKGLPYANYLLSIALIDGKGVKVLEKETHFHISPLPLSPAWVLSLATAPGSNAHQYNIIGTQYLEKNEPHKAVNYLEKAYHQKPFSEKFAIDLCYALLKLEKRKRIKEILTPFFKGIQKVKTSKMYLMMGDNAKAMKNYPAAIHYYQEYLSHFGLNVNVLNALGESYYRTGNLEEARRIFQRSIRENPGQEKVRNFLLKLKDEKFDNNKNEEKGR